MDNTSTIKTAFDRLKQLIADEAPPAEQLAAARELEKAIKESRVKDEGNTSEQL